MRRENAGAAAGRFLGVLRVRRAVGAEEEARVVAGRRFEQRLAVVLALEHRQAVMMRPDAAFEHRIAIQQQVLRRDRRGDARARALHELRGRARRDVLEHDLQVRHAFDDAAQHAVDEGVLAVEHVDAALGDFAVHLQHEPVLGHRFERGPDLLDRGHAGVGVRRRARRVELGADDEAAGLRLADLVGRRAVGQVQRHLRLECQAGRDRCEDACPIRGERGRGRHRRLQVGHHQRAAELPCREGQHGRQLRAVAQVQVPVVGPAQRQRLRGGIHGRDRNCASSPAASPSRCTA